MIEINKKNIDMSSELKMLSILSDLAKNFKNKAGIENQFSLVVINANIAEYLLYLLITVFSQEIEKISNNSKIKFLQIDSEGQFNATKIKTLKYFDFKNREQIIDLLGKIMDCRNAVFHNLVRAHDKKLDITKNIKNIHSHTDKLRLLVAEVLEDLWLKK